MVHLPSIDPGPTQTTGQASGALSWAFIQALSRDPHQQYAQLLRNMRTLLRGKYTQVPQISSSHRINLFTPVNM